MDTWTSNKLFAVSNLKTRTHKYAPQVRPPMNYELVGVCSHAVALQSLCDPQALSCLHVTHHNFEQWKLRGKTLRSKWSRFHLVSQWMCKRQRRMSALTAINMRKLCVCPLYTVVWRVMKVCAQVLRFKCTKGL